ncbi:MAG: hypothetical protein AMXMBFR76_13200 [Pseudomonadota bacterium]
MRGTATPITAAMTAEELDEAGLLRLLQLTSPSLPVGAFAWSQGLEAAVDKGWITAEADAAHWVAGMVSHGLGRMEIPVLLRVHAQLGAGAFDQAGAWNRWLLACRETRELWEEDTHIGAALGRLLASLEAPMMAEWQRHHGRAPLSYAAGFALAAVDSALPARTAALGYLWAYCENQAAALIKLGVLGQTGAQRLLGRLHEPIRKAIRDGSALSDDDLGMSLPGLALASAHHETQHSRLFRS